MGKEEDGGGISKNRIKFLNYSKIFSLFRVCKVRNDKISRDRVKRILIFLLRVWMLFFWW